MSEVNVLFFKESGKFYAEEKIGYPDRIPSYEITNWVAINVRECPSCSMVIQGTNIVPALITKEVRDNKKAVTEGILSPAVDAEEIDTVINYLRQNCKFSINELWRQFSGHRKKVCVSDAAAATWVYLVYLDLKKEGTNSWWHYGKEREAEDSCNEKDIIDMIMLLTTKSYS